jgi:hypothetical protein
VSEAGVTIERVERWTREYDGPAVRITLSNGRAITASNYAYESDSASRLLELCEAMGLPIEDVAGDPPRGFGL